MTETPAPRTVTRRRLWPWLVAGAALAASLLLWFLPLGMEAGLQRWLRDNGAASAEIGDIDFNPFAGQLVVKQLEAHGNGRTLSAEKASLILDWWPLWHRRVEMRDVALEGAVVEVAVAPDGTLGVGPLTFGGQKGETAAEPSPTDARPAWGWAVREVSLEDVQLHFSDSHLQEEATVERLRVRNLSSWQPEAESVFEADLKVGGGALKLSARARPYAAARTATARIEATALALDRLQPLLPEATLAGLNGRLDLATDTTVSLGDDGHLQVKVKGTLAARGLRGTATAVAVAGGDLSWNGTVRLQRGADLGLQLEGILQGDALDLTVPGPDQRIRQQQLRLQGQVWLETGDATVVGAEAALSGRGLVIDDLRRGRNAATVDRLELAKVRFEDATLAAAGLSLGGIALLQRPDGSNGASHALTLAGLDLDRLEIVPGKRVAIGRIALNGGNLLLARDAKGLELQPWLEKPAGAAPEPKSQTKADEPVTLKLDAVALSDCRLRFVDGTLAPPYSETLESLSFELREVDSRTPEHPSPLQIKARIGRYAKLEAAGTVQPFAAKPTLRLEGRVEGFDLPSLNPYTVSLLDYRLNKGHLDTRIKGNVDAGMVDAEIRLTAGKLELEPLREGEQNRFRKVLGMPVSYALSLLRDRQDNIQLKIPVSGDVSDPQLRLADLLTRAVRSGLQRAAVSYYAPLGVTLLTGVVLPPGTLFVAGKAVEWITTMRFQPIEFDPGDSALGEHGAAYLDKTAELIKDRPEVRLVLCGRAAAADLARLRGKATEGAPAPATEEENRQLTELAQSRAHAVKDHLIARGVAADRLLICVPKIELEDEAAPVVEISG